MTTFTLAPVAASTSMEAPPLFITYSLTDGRVYRLETLEGAVPDDISLGLDSLSERADDSYLNVSPDGLWLVLATERFAGECDGWPCLAVVAADLKEGGVVRIGPEQGRLVHPEPGLPAVASGGQLVVYQQEAVISTHFTDLFAVSRSGGEWGAPTVLTGDSTLFWHANPAISDDGSVVLFECGDRETEGHGICEVGADGRGFRVALTPEESPPGGPSEGSLTNPDYSSGGGIIFGADWDGPGVWYLPLGESVSTIMGGEHRWPCVLSDGRIVAAYQDRTAGAGSPDLHLRTLQHDGSGSATVAVLEGAGDVVGGIGCGG